MRLVQASATSPELQARLRDTLNMARDTDKWKKLTAMLSEKVGLCPAQHSTAQHSVRPQDTLHSTPWHCTQLAAARQEAIQVTSHIAHLTGSDPSAPGCCC